MGAEQIRSEELSGRRPRAFGWGRGRGSAPAGTSGTGWAAPRGPAPLPVAGICSPTCFPFPQSPAYLVASITAHFVPRHWMLSRPGLCRLPLACHTASWHFMGERFGCFPHGLVAAVAETRGSLPSSMGTPSPAPSQSSGLPWGRAASRHKGRGCGGGSALILQAVCLLSTAVRSYKKFSQGTQVGPESRLFFNTFHTSHHFFSSSQSLLSK